MTVKLLSASVAAAQNNTLRNQLIRLISFRIFHAKILGPGKETKQLIEKPLALASFLPFLTFLQGIALVLVKFFPGL